MVRLDVMPDARRGVIVLQIVELPAKPLAYIELDPARLSATIATLIAAWYQMGLGGPMQTPGSPDVELPAIVNPEWRVGQSLLSEHTALSFKTLVNNPEPFWLTYALPRPEVSKLVSLLTGVELDPVSSTKTGS